MASSPPMSSKGRAKASAACGAGLGAGLGGPGGGVAGDGDDDQDGFPSSQEDGFDVCPYLDFPDGGPATELAGLSQLGCPEFSFRSQSRIPERFDISSEVGESESPAHLGVDKFLGLSL